MVSVVVCLCVHSLSSIIDITEQTAPLIGRMVMVHMLYLKLFLFFCFLLFCCYLFFIFLLKSLCFDIVVTISVLLREIVLGNWPTLLVVLLFDVVY